MNRPHWRWLTDLEFKCRDEVHPHSPKRALLEFQYQHLLQASVGGLALVVTKGGCKLYREASLFCVVEIPPAFRLS